MVTERIDWHQAWDDWSVDGYIWRFWFIAQGHLVKRRGHVVRELPHLGIDDLEQAAISALMKFAPEWPALAARQEADPSNLKAFWHCLKIRLMWSFSELMQDDHIHDFSVHPDEDGREESSLVRTTLKNHHGHSALLTQVVDLIAQLPELEQVILALYHYEDLGTAGATRVLTAKESASKGSGYHISKRMRDAAEWVLLQTVNLVGDTVTPFPPRTAAANLGLVYRANVEAWLLERYGCDIPTYLEWVRVCYRADVGCVLDVLYAAHGRRRRVDPNQHGRQQAKAARFTDHDIRTIRSRLHLGEGQQAIANDYGVTDSVISRINTRKAYAYVEDIA